jgi:hypothetical protein
VDPQLNDEVILVYLSGFVRWDTGDNSRWCAAHALRNPAWDIDKSSRRGVSSSSYRSFGLAHRHTSRTVCSFQEIPHSSAETDVRPPQLAMGFVPYLFDKIQAVAR